MSKKGKHSIKAGTNNQGSSRFLPLRGRLGGGLRLLLTALLLLAGQRFAFAQSNNAGGPYINSWHRYEVTMGNSGNTYNWEVYTSEAASDAGGAGMAGLNTNRGIVTGTAYIEIYFDNINFTSGTYYLVYEEYSGANCLARRRFDPINVVENNMAIIAGTNVTDCNPLSGQVWDNSIDPISGETSSMDVDFTITLDVTSGDNIGINSWTTTGSIVVTTGSWAITNSFPISGSSSNGTYTISGSAGNFTLTVTGISGNISSDVVTLTISLEGDPTSDLQLDMSINSGGYASYGSQDPGVYVSPTRTVNTTTTQILYGVPNTSLISLSP